MIPYKYWNGQWQRDNRPNVVNLFSRDKEILRPDTLVTFGCCDKTLLPSQLIQEGV